MEWLSVLVKFLMKGNQIKAEVGLLPPFHLSLQSAKPGTVQGGMKKWLKRNCTLAPVASDINEPEKANKMTLILKTQLFSQSAQLEIAWWKTEGHNCFFPLPKKEKSNKTKSRLLGCVWVGWGGLSSYSFRSLWIMQKWWAVKQLLQSTDIAFPSWLRFTVNLSCLSLTIYFQECYSILTSLTLFF